MLPRLLLQLARQSAHGYELMEIISQGDDLASADSGNLYRTLRGLEEEGLVNSKWDTSGVGPARRVYEITMDGREYLHAWVLNMRETRHRLDEFLKQYEEFERTERKESNEQKA
jgi:PadR family transcriptional regulator PadR